MDTEASTVDMEDQTENTEVQTENTEVSIIGTYLEMMGLEGLTAQKDHILTTTTGDLDSPIGEIGVL